MSAAPPRTSEDAGRPAGRQGRQCPIGLRVRDGQHDRGLTVDGGDKRARQTFLRRERDVHARRLVVGALTLYSMTKIWGGAFWGADEVVHEPTDPTTARFGGTGPVQA